MSYSCLITQNFIFVYKLEEVWKGRRQSCPQRISHLRHTWSLIWACKVLYKWLSNCKLSSYPNCIVSLEEPPLPWRWLRTADLQQRWPACTQGRAPQVIKVRLPLVRKNESLKQNSGSFLVKCDKCIFCPGDILICYMYTIFSWKQFYLGATISPRCQLKK